MAVQTTNITVRHFHLRIVAIAVSVLMIVSLESGCARTRPAITSLWQQVPPVRWPGKETHPDRGSADNLAEPAVAANVALQQDSTSQSESTSEVLARGEETSAGGKSKSPPRRLGLPLISSDRETEGTSSDPNSREPAESTHAHPTETEQFNSPLERLNAALTDDVRHAMTLPRRSVTALEERFRVDSLISRAKELFAIGQLDRAHEAAIAAQKLGDAAQLDYAPDEDRPLDLVRRIEGQMDATRLTQEPGTADESSAATRTEEPEKTSQLSTQLATPPAKEAKGTPKTPRNWSTFFRREKKPAAPASEDLVTPGPLTQDPVTQVSSEAIRNTFRADRIDSTPPARTHQIPAHDAIVMANRSVSLEARESISESRTVATSRTTDPRTIETVTTAPEAIPATTRAPGSSESEDCAAEEDRVPARISSRVLAAAIRSSDPMRETESESRSLPSTRKHVGIPAQSGAEILMEAIEEPDQNPKSRSFSLGLAVGLVGFVSLLVIGLFRRPISQVFGLAKSRH